MSLFLNFRGSPRGSVRRASGLVLVGNPYIGITSRLAVMQERVSESSQRTARLILDAGTSCSPSAYPPRRSRQTDNASCSCIHREGEHNGALR
jgi:hypothetical protein